MTGGGIAGGLNTWPGSCPGHHALKIEKAKHDEVNPELIML
jgi:hypothetical protein